MNILFPGFLSTTFAFVFFYYVLTNYVFEYIVRVFFFPFYIFCLVAP